MSRITPAERAALEAYVRSHGSVKIAAYALGKSRYTVNRQLESARGRLDAGSSLEAAEKAGIFRFSGDREAA